MTLLYADDRAYLTVTHQDRYALGDPEAPLIVLNAADAHGCAWIAEEPDEWAAPAVVTPMDRRQDGHGGYVGLSTFEPRTITLVGNVSAPTNAALRAARSRLLSAALGNLTGFLRYTHLDDDPAKGLWTRPVGQPLFRALDDRLAQFSVVLLAEDPIKTGAAVTYGPVRLMPPTGEGARSYPRVYDRAEGRSYTLGGPQTTTAAYVANDGDEAAHATYTVTGPIPEPVVQLSTGEFFGLTADLGADDVLVVDTANGTVQVNGVNRDDALLGRSTFPLIPPGGAEVRLRSAAGGTSPDASLLITTAPSWR